MPVALSEPAGASPTVALASPDDGAGLTAPTPATGLVSGGAWKLELGLGAVADASSRRPLASGTGAAAGVLARLDTTLLLNGT